MRASMAAVLIGAVVLGASPHASADDVTDQIDEAIKAYQAKDLATAAAALGAAQDLIRQQSADAWKTMLPEPLPGWTAAEATSTSAAAALLGGGTNVSRDYRKGGDSVTVDLVTDSPLMAGLGKLMSSGLVTGPKVLMQVKGSTGVDEKTRSSVPAL
jgi:hypothetical protein